jgi:hypothetical protein
MEGIVIGLAVLGWLLWRQLQVRELRRDKGYGAALVMVAIGVVEVVRYAGETHLGATGDVLLATSIAVAAGFGVVRAGTVRIWCEDGRLLRQGTAITAALWLAAIAVHLAGDQVIAPHDAERIGSVSLLLYLGVSLAVQRAALGERARRLDGREARLG